MSHSENDISLKVFFEVIFHRYFSLPLIYFCFIHKFYLLYLSLKKVYKLSDMISQKVYKMITEIVYLGSCFYKLTIPKIDLFSLPFSLRYSDEKFIAISQDKFISLLKRFITWKYFCNDIIQVFSTKRWTQIHQI
jgi:hypothetical protein